MTEQPEFRWRGREIARIEGLSDAVFAFAVTLLVVSLEVPHSFSQLRDTMLGFPAFGVCFTLLMLVWYAQHTFFRRYGMQDIQTISLNVALLFLVLFYVYPLKFLWTFLFDRLLGLNRERAAQALDSAEQMQDLMVIYAVGFIAVFLVFVLLHFHALRNRMQLSLTPEETFDTRSSIQFYSVFVAVGCLSLIITLVGGPRWSAVAGLSYGLLGPALTYHGHV